MLRLLFAYAAPISRTVVAGCVVPV